MLNKLVSSLFDRKWRRLAAPDFPINISKVKKYIFFPWQGFIHWIILTVLVSFCLNYGNNIGIACICFLAIMYLTNLFRNYYSLNAIEILGITQAFHDSQQLGSITFHLRYNKGSHQKANYNEISRKKSLRSKRILSYPICSLDIEGVTIPIIFRSDGLCDAIWNYGIKEWGIFHLPRIRLSTLWPSSITRTWVDLKIPGDVIIVPATQGLDGIQNSISQVSEGVATSSTSSYGDIDGIRPLLPSEHQKISWKHTIKYGHLITYTWEALRKESIIISWPVGSADSSQKMLIMRSAVDLAIQQNKPFQIMHPQFSTTFGSGLPFGIHSLAFLMSHVLPSKEWRNQKKIMPKKGDL